MLAFAILFLILLGFFALIPPQTVAPERTEAQDRSPQSRRANEENRPSAQEPNPAPPQEPPLNLFPEEQSAAPEPL
jgi:hypothetical protein